MPRNDKYKSICYSKRKRDDVGPRCKRRFEFGMKTRYQRAFKAWPFQVCFHRDHANVPLQLVQGSGSSREAVKRHGASSTMASRALRRLNIFKRMLNLRGCHNDPDSYSFVLLSAFVLVSRLFASCFLVLRGVALERTLPSMLCQVTLGG